MNEWEKYFLADFCSKYGAATLVTGNKILASMGDMGAKPLSRPILFEQKVLGFLQVSPEAPENECIDLAHRLAPLLHFPEGNDVWPVRLLRLLVWVDGARALYPEISNWIGLYIRESAIFGGSSTDLVVGPYFGEVTDHVRIPVDRGICGLAIREERVVNVKDVNQDARHIACSLKTKSELVIPLYDGGGNLVAELDIDSHKLDAFSESIEARYRRYSETFPSVWG